MTPLRGQRVLVTGAAGFLGRHLVRRLLEDGAIVIAAVRPASERASVLPESVGRVVVDVTRGDDVRAAVASSAPDAIVHLAATTSVRGASSRSTIERSIEVNLRGSMNVALAAVDARVPRLVRTGGLEEYGTGPTPFLETQREEPSSPYSASQVATTHYLQVLQRTAPATTLVTVRPALVYGPGQSSEFFLPSLIDHCLRGDDFPMTDGTQARDLLYIGDAVDGIVKAVAEVVPGGSIFNLSHGVEHRMIDVATTVQRLVGAGRLLVGARPSPASDLEHLVASSALAADVLGWRPQVELEEGLRRTVEAARAALDADVRT